MVRLLLFISFPFFLFAFSLNSDINFYSDHLKYNVFDDKWKYIPSTKKNNRAFVNSFIEISNKNVGLFYISQGYTRINKGFIETWYYASNDFDTLLKKDDIGHYISEEEIDGILIYYQGYGVFYKKNFNNFFLRFNLIKGKQLQYIRVTGSNTQDRFIANLDYVYTDKNIITHAFEDNNDYYGIGGSVDCGFEYKYKDLKINLKLQNILGFIKWYNVNYMKYYFDSNTKYIGDDGYYHYKPFGVGKYYEDEFFLKLPYFYSGDIFYKRFGIETYGSRNIFYNIAYFKKKFFKLGYIPQQHLFLVGLNFNHFKIESITNFNTKKLYKLSFTLSY